MMSNSLNQAAWVGGTSTYKFGHNSIPNIPITGAPSDTNWNRSAMLHDGTTYRLYFFKGSSDDTIYQFGFNRATGAYEYGFNSIPELKLTGAPRDASAESFAMLHDGTTYRLYLRRLGHPDILYQFGFNRASRDYEFGFNSIQVLHVDHAPADVDWSSWGMLHDGSAYRFYAFKQGTKDKFYQGAYNPAAREYQFGFNSIPEFRLDGMPADSNLSDFPMLHDGRDYRFYMLKN